jgi:hypothetical protein
MIEPELEEQVERLLAEGKLSYRKIARFTGVSRGTIGAIASGRRRIQPRRIFFWEDEPVIPDVPPQRCPQCGGMVYMPCRLCRTRKEMAKLPDARALIGPHPNPLPKGEGTKIPNPLPKGEGAFRANAFQPFTPIGLNLKPVHQQRYEEVRRWRREQREGSGFRTQVRR